MRHSIGKRARICGALLAVALAALALALPAIGLNSHGGDREGAAGTVRSFDPETGTLVVDLAKGDAIAGLVVRRTKIRCGNGRRHHRRWRRASASHRRDEARGDVRNDQARDRSGEVDDNGPSVNGEDRVGDDNPRADEDDAVRRRHRRPRCNTGDLVPGAIVMRAEIVLAHGKAFYKRIGLLPPQHSATPDVTESE